MNKEDIDKILDDYLSDYHKKVVKDYIEEIEMYKGLIKSHLGAIDRKDKEIERLNQGYCELKEKCNKGECDCTHEEYNGMCEENIKLMNRIDKAIEYINNKEFIDYKKGLGNLERMLKHRQDLLGILKGSDKE